MTVKGIISPRFELGLFAPICRQMLLLHQVTLVEAWTDLIERLECSSRTTNYLSSNIFLLVTSRSDRIRYR